MRYEYKLGDKLILVNKPDSVKGSSWPSSYKNGDVMTFRRYIYPKSSTYWYFFESNEIDTHHGGLGCDIRYCIPLGDYLKDLQDLQDFCALISL